MWGGRTRDLRWGLRERNYTRLNDDGTITITQNVGRGKLGLLQAIEGSKVLQNIPATQELIKTLSPDFQKMLNEIRSTQRYANRTNTEIAIFRRRNGTVAEFGTVKKAEGADVLTITEPVIVDAVDATELALLKNDFVKEPKLLESLVDEPGLVESWKVLDEAGETALRTDITELENVAAHLDEIKAAGGYKKWKLAKGADDFADYVKTLKTKVNPRKDYPDGIFERHVTGDDIQYEAIGGGEKIWADGIDSGKKALLDAKHNPSTFYTIESYNQKTISLW